MLAFLTRRLVLALITVWAISLITFAIIQLPPGDYVSAYIAQLETQGDVVSEEEAIAIRAEYGLEQPIPVQYLKWMQQAFKGNFGVAMEYRRPVLDVIGDRLALTAALTFT